MKKLLIILLIFAIALLLRPHKSVSYAHANSSYVVVEESSGRVLMGENEKNLSWIVITMRQNKR